MVEIYQNCNIFNDGAFDILKDPETRDAALIKLAAGEPIVFDQGRKGVIRGGSCGLTVVDTDAVDAGDILVHNPAASSPLTAFALSALSAPGNDTRTAIGVFRDVEQPSYNEAFAKQIATVVDPDADFAALLAGNDTWTVS